MFCSLDYLEHTLLFHQSDPGNKGMAAAKESLQFLIDNSFVTVDRDKMIPNRLAVATLASTFLPEDAIFVHKALERASLHLVLKDELHLLYLVTPVKIGTPNWSKFIGIYENLRDWHKTVAEAIGINQGYLVSLSQGFAVAKDNRFAIHLRFFNALMLFDLVRGVPLSQLVWKYGVDRGSIQQLQTLCCTFSGMVKIFCNRIGWPFYDVLISHIQQKLAFGIEADLNALMKIPKVDRAKAKILYDLGLKTPHEVSQCDVKTIVGALGKLFAGQPDSARFKIAAAIIKEAQDLI